MSDAVLTVDDEKSRLIIGFDSETGLLHVEMQRLIMSPGLGSESFGWTTMMTTDVDGLLVST